MIVSPAREALEAARARYEPVAGEMPPHVTVLPPIDVDYDALPAIVAHLDRVAAATRGFAMSLRGTGSFRPVSPVAFVVVTSGVEECTALEARVRAGDMAVEARFPYHPHVTVAHDVPEAVLDQAIADLATFEADMLVRSMGLYERVDGRWELVRDFDFAG